MVGVRLLRAPSVEAWAKSPSDPIFYSVTKEKEGMVKLIYIRAKLTKAWLNA